MELIALILGIVIRILLPTALLFWASAHLQTWDQRRGRP
jgi:hypothetical protein